MRRSLGPPIVQDQLAHFVIDIEVQVASEFVAANEDHIVKALGNFDHHFDDEAGSSDAAGVSRRHGKAALSIANGHVVALVFSSSRVSVGGSCKTQKQRATAAQQ